MLHGRRPRRPRHEPPRGNGLLAAALLVLLVAAVPCRGFAAAPPRSLRSTVARARARPSRLFAEKGGGAGPAPENATPDDDSAAADLDSSSSASTPSQTARIYLDVSVSDQPIGRLVFLLPLPNPLPLHAENVVGLCRGSRRSIDPAATYVGCAFNYSPQYIEGMAQYRWGHVLPGRGRNAVGKADSRIEEPDALSRCQQSAFGGSYYGLRYRDLPGTEEGGDGAVALTVPLSGPGRGSSCLSIVRVGESPREWGERLLTNGAVLGWMDPSCGDVLRTMARQRVGPPVVVASGVLEDEEA